MKNRLTKMQIVKLIFFSSVKIEEKKYKIQWIMETIQIFMNLFFIMGGIIFIAVGFDHFFKLINLTVDGYISSILSILLILIVNILIIKFSTLVEIKDNKIDIDKSINNEKN